MADELRDLNEGDGMGGRGASAIRSYPLIAWFIIIALTMTVMLMHMLGSDASSAAEVAEQNVMDRLEGETALGMAQLQGETAARPTMAKFEVGSMAQRLRGVVLKAVILAPDEGLNELRQIEVQAEESGYEPTESELETMQLLQQLYEHPVPEGRVPLNDAQRVQLVDQLGWFGQVALAFDSEDSAAQADLLGSAQWIAIVLMVLAVGGIGALVLGVILLILLITFACMRKVRHHFGSARSTDGLLAEAFAIWLLCFLGLHLLLEMLAHSVPEMKPHMLGLTGALHCVTAAAVAWPVIRGVDWNSVRASIGWTRGAGFWKECGLGICGWFMTLPLLGIGVLIMLLLMAITTGGQQGTGFEPVSQPVHPIITAVADGDVWIMLQVYFVAAMVAPFLEETVFRGLLYRQLRSATSAWSIVASVAVSALLVSVVFAALHPQGVLAIPALAALAIGMTLMREWRGSLLASIVMHAMNNGLMITLMVVLFS